VIEFGNWNVERGVKDTGGVAKVARWRKSKDEVRWARDDGRKENKL